MNLISSSIPEPINSLIKKFVNSGNVSISFNSSFFDSTNCLNTLKIISICLLSVESFSVIIGDAAVVVIGVVVVVIVLVVVDGIEVVIVDMNDEDVKYLLLLS